MSEGPQRRLVAFASANVVGVSRLMGAEEVDTIAALTRHRSLILTAETNPDARFLHQASWKVATVEL